MLKEPDNFGVLGVEILPDANLPLPRAKPPLFSRAAVRDQPRDRFTGLCKHNFLTCRRFFDEPRQMGLCRLNVYGLQLKTKSGLVYETVQQQIFSKESRLPFAAVSSRSEPKAAFADLGFLANNKRPIMRGRTSMQILKL